MPHSKKDTAALAEFPNPFAFGEIDAVGAQQSAAMAEMNESALKNIAALHHEVAGFIDHRLQKDMELQNSLSKCQSAADAFQTCSDFWQQTFTEYWQETAKLSDMAMRSPFVGVPGQTKTKQAAE